MDFEKKEKSLGTEIHQPTLVNQAASEKSLRQSFANGCVPKFGRIEGVQIAICTPKIWDASFANQCLPVWVG